MNILLASNNPHKKEEFHRLLPSHAIILPQDLGLDYSFEEDKETFTENALGKALALAKTAPQGYAVLSDDSGLCVDALGGGPGVRTARYGMETFNRMLESEERNAFLLQNLSHLPDREQRKAHFVCALALVVSEYRIFTICESVDGYIALESYGKGGFGYDPVFIVAETGKTMAALTDTQKDRYSHRGKAARHLVTLLEDL